MTPISGYRRLTCEPPTFQVIFHLQPLSICTGIDLYFFHLFWRGLHGGLVGGCRARKQWDLAWVIASRHSSLTPKRCSCRSEMVVNQPPCPHLCFKIKCDCLNCVSNQSISVYLAPTGNFGGASLYDSTGYLSNLVLGLAAVIFPKRSHNSPD